MVSESIDPYIHAPLSTDDGIRVLELLPGLLEDPLEARLLEVRLSEEPIYSALSYCWGAPNFDTLLKCDGHALYITESLAFALESLRYDTEPLVIWIDQVCINQKDIEERNRQVQLMRRIYSSAEDVLVWLGSPTDSSDFMFECMSTGTVEFADIPIFFSAVAEFMSRAWFTRTWTVQEVVLARDEPQVFCGSANLSWSEFGWFLNTVYQRFSQRVPVSEDTIFPTLYSKSIDDLDAWKQFLGETSAIRTDQRMRAIFKVFLDGAMRFLRVQGMRVQGSSASFTTQLLRTLELQATDQRDKVFGLLGMCAFGSDPIIPDYSKPVTKVYSEAMAKIITQELALGFSTLVFDIGRSGEMQNLPSWVPNFAAQTNLDSKLVSPQHLLPKSPETITTAIEQASSKHPIATFSDDFQILHARGIEFGYIEASFTVPKYGESVWGMEWWEHWFSQMVSMVRGRHIPLEHILDSTHRPHCGRYDRWDEVVSAFEKLFTAANERENILTTLDLTSNTRSLLDEFKEFRDFTMVSCLDNTFFVTGTGRVGRCQGAVAQEDVLVGLFGINVPFILRKKEEAFSMVSVAHVAGHCYNHASVENADGKCHSGAAETCRPESFTIV